MVSLEEWNTIKKHVEILEQKGCEVIETSKKVIETSKKGCEVREISNVVKSMMEAIANDQPVFGISDPNMQEFSESGEVGDPVSEMPPTANAATFPELLKKHPMPPASPPPRRLMLQAARTGPFVNMVPPKDNRPWRSTAPYTKTSCGSTSSWDTSSWDTHECWA